MNSIVEKRSKLINFFKNENKTYSKEDILNKEFAVLSFSPMEEYIDILQTPFDDFCDDLSTFANLNCDEVYVKGIIVDVDRKNGYTIIHIQNKDASGSITCSGGALQKYNDYLVTGEPIIAKCSIYNERASLSFLISLNNLEKFEQESDYINGKAFTKIDTIMKGREKSHKQYGVIVHCKLTKNKNNRDMVIGSLYDGKEIRGFATVKTPFNRKIPSFAVAGDFVKFTKPTNEFLLNDVEVVHEDF